MCLRVYVEHYKIFSYVRESAPCFSPEAIAREGERERPVCAKSPVVRDAFSPALICARRFICSVRNFYKLSVSRSEVAVVSPKRKYIENYVYAILIVARATKRKR